MLAINVSITNLMVDPTCAVSTVATLLTYTCNKGARSLRFD